MIGGDSGQVGGLVGENGGGSIEDAYATGVVTDGGNGNAGGLVGFNDDGTIEDAYATGAVTGEDAYADDVGGLVGLNDNNGSITDAYATGAVTGDVVGGLVGQNNDSLIEDAYATGAVTTGDGEAGGLVGYILPGGTTEDAYATGAVTGAEGSYVGGLAGVEDGAYLADDYFDTTTSGTTTGVGLSIGGGGVTGLSTTQLEGSLAGFSSTVWGNVGGQTTPYLLNNIGQQSVYVGADTYTSTLISTLPELQAINNDLSGNYALAVDLNATGDALTPIGERTAFTGTFDGLGNTISNLTIDDTTDTNVGLFGQVGSGGVVENVGLLGDSIEATDDDSDVGGLVGENSGTIEDAYATGVVTGEDALYVGGLVGENSGTIEDAYATGAVAGVGSGDVGGLVGYNDDGTIEDAYATGAVSDGETGEVGGLVGNSYYGTIKDAYATGAVSDGEGSSMIGGLVGDNDDGTIEDAYATGAVTGGVGSSMIGGLVGYAYNSTATDDYFDTTSSGTTTGVGTG